MTAADAGIVPHGPKAQRRGWRRRTKADSQREIQLQRSGAISDLTMHSHVLWRKPRGSSEVAMVVPGHRLSYWPARATLKAMATPIADAYFSPRRGEVRLGFGFPARRIDYHSFDGSASPMNASGVIEGNASDFTPPRRQRRCDSDAPAIQWLNALIVSAIHSD